MITTRTHSAARGALAAATLAALAACTSHPLWAPSPQPQEQTANTFEENLSRDLDVLVMVDDSLSMANKQANLARNFPILIDELRKTAGGLPNLHLGIVSSDAGAGVTPVGTCHPGGDDGALHATPTGACPGLRDPGARFIVSEDGETRNNYDGDIGDVFGCLARLGTQGCGLEEPLRSVALALAPGPGAVNPGFLRDDAVLAVLLITDEDDCSVPPTSTLFEPASIPPGVNINYLCYPPAALCGGQPPPEVPFSRPLAECGPRPDGGGALVPVADFVTFLRSLKHDPDDVVVSAIAGVPQAGETGTYQTVERNGEVDIAFSACAGNGGGAPALRIAALVDAFGTNGTMSSICADDFGPAMRRTGELVAAHLDPHCLDQPFIDGDPKTPGVQPDCTVTETGNGPPRALPRCGAGQTPCWELRAPGATGNACKAGFSLAVTRTAPARRGTGVAIKCATCPTAGDPRCGVR